MGYLIVITWLYTIGYTVYMVDWTATTAPTIHHDFKASDSPVRLPIGFTYGRYRANQDWTRR